MLKNLPPPKRVPVEFMRLSTELISFVFFPPLEVSGREAQEIQSIAGVRGGSKDKSQV